MHDLKAEWLDGMYICVHDVLLYRNNIIVVQPWSYLNTLHSGRQRGQMLCAVQERSRPIRSRLQDYMMPAGRKVDILLAESQIS